MASNMQESGADSLAVNLDGAVWIPYKELFALIGSIVYGKDESRIPNLESTLRTYKVDFLRLLKNPAKRPQSREVVKKAVTDGIRILGQQEPRVLSQSVVDEAILISDLFDLNEVVALELLLTGESQQPRLSFLARGLAAVLLYYDGRRCFINSLRALIQSRKGRYWTLDLAPEITDLATKYTDDLWNEGLRDQLFNQLVSFSPAREHERLESSLALGNAKHRKKIMDLIEEVHTSLAECLYCWSCQTGLVTVDVIRLITVLAEVVPSRSDGGLDGAQFTLILALFYSLDCEPLRSSDDFYDSFEAIPVTDPDFVTSVHKEIMSLNQWKCPALKAAIQFVWAVSLRNLSRVPIAQGARQQYDEEDEMVLDVALEGGALRFFRNAIVGNQRFFTEEFFVRRIHGIVTDFVDHFPLKVKELRTRSDELARVVAQGEWGLEEATPIYFKDLLELIAAIYSRDAFNSELALDYWCPPDVQSGVRSSVYCPTNKQVNLYKFVRLSGDLLPPLLYVPYVDMLNGLARSPMGARHCFHLLKANGTSGGGGHGHGGPGGGGGGRHYPHSIISWDHFFASMQRYLASLRQDQPAHTLRAMSPQELDGLCAFLRLTETIACNDDMSCHSLAENAEWTPLFTFVGLLTCCVPVVLKARLVLALAAFSKSTEASVMIWHALEAALLLPSSASSEFHIRTELNEVESRNEEYPLTRAFVQLLTVFVTSFSQLEIRNLSSKFEACVLFIVDDVFSRFNSRSYKSVDEKWQVACSCLEFLIKLMTSNEPGTCVIRPTATPTVGFRPVKLFGGDLVLSHMLQDTRLFRTVMYVIDESLKVFTSYASIMGKETLERCALLSLRIVHSALERQVAFMAALREANSDMIMTGVDQLLISINQQTGKADFPTRIAKFSIFNDSLPEHAFFAVSILSWMSRSLTSQDQIIAAFLLNQDDSNELRQGFVECLEADDDDDVSSDVAWTASTVEDTLSDSRTRGATRRSILRLLLGCLNFPPPNLAIFFLGYDLYRPSLKTVLQDPGVLRSPYTCLHAVLEILFRGNGEGLTVTRELCQRLVYTACANSDTSLPTLRYLRTSHDFLFRHLRIIASRLQNRDKSYEMSILNSQTWLLKTVAIEIRLLSASGQRSSLHRLTEALLGETGNGTRPDGGGGGILNLSGDPAPSSSSSVSFSRCLLLAILDQLDWSQSFPKAPQWDFFDAGVMEQVIVQCERSTADGYLAVDVQRLHRFLLMEVGNLHGAGTAVRRPIIAEEIRSVLQYVVSRNRVRHALHSKRQALDAWRQLTETVFLSIPVDAIHNVPIILELTHTLLHKILSESSFPELTQRASGVLLTLLVGLRRCFTMGSPVPAWTPFASSLEALLKGLLECVIQAGTGPSKLRAHYYGALLSFLRLTGTSSSPEGASAEDSRQKFVMRCIEISNSYGDGIYEILCSDACNTNDITKMMSLCCLSIFVSNDLSDALLRFMVTRGYLADCVNSLRADDRQLQAILSSQTANLRGLYIYETKMAFFIHLASSAKGAQLLLGSGFLEFLAEMQSIGMKPECSGESMSDDSDSLVVNNYFQVLVPALKASALLIASPVSNALEAKSKVLNLLVSHADCFGSLLREVSSGRCGTNDYAIISAFVARGLLDLDMTDASAETQSEVSRLWRLVQALLPAVIEARRVSVHRRRSVRSEPMVSEQRDDLDWARAVTGLLSFCVSLAQSTNEGVRAQTFRANMVIEDSPACGVVGSLRSLPDLGHLVFLLKSCSEDVLKSERLPAAVSVGYEDVQSPCPVGVAEISLQSRNLFICIIEHALFLLYFHLEFYIVQSASSKRPLMSRAETTSGPRTSRLRRLQGLPFGESSGDSPVRSFDVTSDTDGPTTHDGSFPLSSEEVATLQNDCRRGLTDVLLASVLQVSERLVSSQKSRFMVAMIRRLRWILSLRLS